MTRVFRRLPAVALAAVATLATGAAVGTQATAANRVQEATCVDQALLFCEDFDGLAAGPAASENWATDTRAGTLTVEELVPTDEAGSSARRVPGKGTADDPVEPGGPGGNVLHVQTQDNGMAFLKVEGFTAPENRFFGRMRLRVDAFPTAPDWAHFTLVEVTGTGSSEIVRPIGGQYVPTVDKSLWGVGADGGPTGDWTNWRESAPVSEDTWQCFEWQVDAADNRVAVWIDGVENPELVATTDSHGGNPVPFILPTVDTVKIGWQLYQAGTVPGQFDAWIDDIALGTERLGC